MCIPAAGLAGIGVALSVAGSLYSGFAGAAASNGAAKQYEIERIGNATATSQAARDRFREFSDLEAANRLSAAASGLTVDSFGDLMEANRKTALEDAKRIEDSGKATDLSLRTARKQAKSGARASIFGGVVGSLASLDWKGAAETKQATSKRS